MSVTVGKDSTSSQLHWLSGPELYVTFHSVMIISADFLFTAYAWLILAFFSLQYDNQAGWCGSRAVD
jgi:hypothetical protein